MLRGWPTIMMGKILLMLVLVVVLVQEKIPVLVVLLIQLKTPALVVIPV